MTIALIFVLEIVCDVLRWVFPRTTVPIYISSIVTFIVTATLIACYVSAAVSIARRIGTRGKKVVRHMTLRITVSSLGYVICLAALIAFAVAYTEVWGRAMTLNAVYLGLNLAGIMQVLALRPIRPSKSSKSKSSSNHSVEGTHSAKLALDTPDPSSK